MAKKYDLAVIGSGTAAQVASHLIASVGWKVAVIDHRPFGGTCALRGCDPKKMLLTGARVIDDIRRMTGKGIVAHQAQVAWRDLMAFKRTFTGPIPEKQERRYREKGIDTYHGTAQFVAPNALQIRGDRLESRYILIATGARPVPLAFPGDEHLITNEEFLELDDLPKRSVLVGGGYVASEFSHIASRSGASVIVLQRAIRVLPEFDPDLVEWLMASFLSAGIDVRTEHSVEAVEKNGAGFSVRAMTRNGEKTFQ